MKIKRKVINTSAYLAANVPAAAPALATDGFPVKGPCMIQFDWLTSLLAPFTGAGQTVGWYEYQEGQWTTGGEPNITASSSTGLRGTAITVSGTEQTASFIVCPKTTRVALRNFTNSVAVRARVVVSDLTPKPTIT